MLHPHSTRDRTDHWGTQHVGIRKLTQSTLTAHRIPSIYIITCNKVNVSHLTPNLAYHSALGQTLHIFQLPHNFWTLYYSSLYNVNVIMYHSHIRMGRLRFEKYSPPTRVKPGTRQSMFVILPSSQVDSR